MRAAALSALLAAVAAAPAAAARRAKTPAPARPRLQPVLVEQRGHSLSVDAVALSADGTLAATAGKDGRAILWEADGGRTLRAFAADPLGVTAVALSADGRRLLTAGAGTAALWDTETGRLLRRFGRPGEFLVRALFSPGEREVLTAGGDAAARLWDAATGKLLREYGVEARRLTDMALSRDGTRLALAAGKDEVWLFDVKSGAMLRALPAGGAALRAAFSPDGKRLAAGGESGVWVWDLVEGRAVSAFKAPAARGLAFLDGGRSLVTCGGGGTARVWSLEGEPGRSFIGHADAVRALALSADGARLITGSDDRSARVWDARAGRELRALAGAPAPILEALASADGRRLVTVDAQTARLWDLDSAALVRVTTGDFAGSSSWSLSASGRLLADVRDRELVDLKNLETGQDFGTFQWNLLRASEVALTPDGGTVITANDGRIQLWDARAMRERPGAPKAATGVNRLWTALGGRGVLYLDGYGALHLWDAAKDQARADWPARGPAPPDVAVSPDGAYLATAEPAGGRAVFSVRSLEDGTLLAGWDADRSAAPYALAPGGRRLLVRSGRSVLDWDAAAQKAARSWELPRGLSLDWPRAVDPGWRWLAASGEGAAVFLSLETGRERLRLSLSERGWVARAPSGAFDASDGALRWTVGLKSLPLSALPGARREPGLLGKALRAGR